MYELDGIYWPEDAEVYQKNYYEHHSNDMAYVTGLCRQRKVCIQAGGNIGIWPNKLSLEFKTVYTFEPHPELFQCMMENCRSNNVIKMQALVGYHHPPKALNYKGLGSHHVSDSEGPYPTIQIDNLHLNHCDAIFLDIEGYEYYALLGASKTIDKFRPIIQIEDQGFEERYGLMAGEPENFLLRKGYKKGEKVGHDRIYLPRV